MPRRAAAPESQRWDLWAKLVVFLLVGYTLTGRSFAYFGIPPAKLFIGDMVLFAFIVLRPRQIFDRWIGGLTKGGLLSPFCWVLLLSILYGVVELIRGILNRFEPLTAIQNLVFNVYPLYLFLGIWIGMRYPDLLLKWIRIFAWALCIYGPLYLGVLHSLPILMPGADKVTIFGQPSGETAVLLGLVCLDPKPSRYWLPLTVAAFMLLAIQVRAEWIGFALALLIWGVLARKMGRVSFIAMGIAVLLVIGFILNFDLPSTAERGGAVSSREIVARGLAAVNPSLAEQYTDSGNTRFYAATIQWRETWWRSIWANSLENKTLFLVGPGYGFELKNLVSYLRNEDIRTPHNIFFYALGYSGWIGVFVFFSLQTTCMIMLWRIYRMTGQPFGLALWASYLIAAFFENLLETPFGAIPFYLIIGLIVGPYLDAAGYSLRQRYVEAQSRPVVYVPEGV